MSGLPFGETLTIWRAPAPTFPTMGDAPTAVVLSVVPRCAFWPTTTAEVIASQDTVTWDASAILPPDTDIEATDQVEHLGVMYEVVGQPSFWKSSFTGKRFWEIQLKAATG